MAQHPHTVIITELRLAASDIRRHDRKLKEAHVRRDDLVHRAKELGLADRLIAAAAGVSRARVGQIKSS